MINLTNIKARLFGLYAWAADAGHRRALAYIITLVAGHFLGKEYDIDNIDTILAVLLGAGAAAWSPMTPVDVDKAGAS